MDRRQRQMRFMLIISTLILGACGLIYEYMLSVLGNHLIGSSYEEIFIVIGLMMFAMGLGAGFQRFVKEELFEKFLLLEIFLGLIGGFSATLIYMAFIHTESHRVILYAFSLLIGLLVGLEIPIIIRINQVYALNLRANLSEILSVDYVGALVGAVVFTYVLLTRFSLAQIGYLIGLVNVLVGLAGYCFFLSHVLRKKLVGCVLIAAGVLLTFGFIKADAWTRYTEQRYYRDPIVKSQTTPYQHLVLTQRDDRLRFYINGHLQFSSRDEQIYHEMLVLPAMHAADCRKRVLILGGGDGLALREVLKFPDVESVTLVELDPAVIALAREHPEMVRLNGGAFHDARVKTIETEAVTPGEEVVIAHESERTSEMFTGKVHERARVHLVIMDAERFVRETEGLFDLVFIDFPDPDELELAKLYSTDFYTDLRDRLTPRGMVTVQATSPYYARRVYQCIGKTLEESGFQVVPYHDNVPSFGEWGWYVAWDGKAPAGTLKERLDTLDRLEVETRYLTPEILRASRVFGKDWLRPQEEIRANTVMRPVILDYFRDAWKGV